MNTITEETRKLISWGHQYGKPFGFREIRAMQKLVARGEWVEVSRSRWSVRGPKDGYQHGFDATFRKVAKD